MDFSSLQKTVVFTLSLVSIQENKPYILSGAASHFLFLLKQKRLGRFLEVAEPADGRCLKFSDRFSRRWYSSHPGGIVAAMASSFKMNLAKQAAEYVSGKSPQEIKRLTRHFGRTLKPKRAKHERVRRKPGKNHWEDWEVALLGKLPDAEVAKRTKRTYLAVTSQRALRKINICNHWYDWEVALLGTAKDSTIAKRLKRTIEAVKCRRQKLGIASFVQMHKWTSSEDEVVMGCTLKEAAQRLNRPGHAVESRRRTLLAGNIGKAARAWTAEEIALLGKYSDTELCRKLKRSRCSVAWKRRVLKINAHGDYSRRWTKAEDRLLGTMPDSELSKKLSRGVKAVQHRRLKFGLLFHGSRSGVKKVPRPRTLK